MLRGAACPERVVQLCHHDLVNDFPPLRNCDATVTSHLPAQLTSFVGRDAELADLRRLVDEHRLVTVSGAGGVGKTRPALTLYLSAPDSIECLAALAVDSGDHRQAARLFGCAAAMRERTGVVRFNIYDPDYAAALDVLRQAMQHNDFEESWAAGAALSTVEAVTHARRGRDRPSERRRPSSGWDSLTATERDVVHLVGEGLRNKDIAARLFYAKLDLSYRARLVQEAARRT